MLSLIFPQLLLSFNRHGRRHGGRPIFLLSSKLVKPVIDKLNQQSANQSSSFPRLLLYFNSYGRRHGGRLTFHLWVSIICLSVPTTIAKRRNCLLLLIDQGTWWIMAVMEGRKPTTIKKTQLMNPTYHAN